MLSVEAPDLWDSLKASNINGKLFDNPGDYGSLWNVLELHAVKYIKLN